MATQGAPSRRRTLWTTLGAASAVVLAVLLWRHQATVVAWMQRAHPVPFVAIMAVLPAFGVPSAPLFLLIGATFGIRGGLIGAALAIAANLALCYAISTTGLRRVVAPALSALGYELPDFRAGEKSSLRFVLVVKLTPGLPTFAKNYLLGLARVPFWLYFWLSLAITWAYGAALVVIGESLFDHRKRWLWIAAAAALVLAGLWKLGKRRMLAQSAGA